MGSQFGRAMLAAQRLAALAVAVLLAAACSTTGQSPNSTMSPNPDRQFQELMARPDIDEISRRYEQMAVAIQAKLVSETGLPPWKSAPGDRSSCREFPDIDTADKESRSLPLWSTDTNVPDDKWPQAVQVVTEIAKDSGFGQPKTVVDTPGRHQVSLEDSYGAEFTFGTRVHTTMLILTGCHLTPEAHKRGKPSAGP